MFSMLGILLVACCTCDDPTDIECANYDPCHDIEPLIASFGAGYILDLPGSDLFNSFYPDTVIYLDGDTIPGTCTFYSYTNNADSFYYKVGQDPSLFTDKQFYLEFSNEFHLEPISVTHIVKGRGECYKNNTSTDTLTRNFVITNQPLDPPNPKFFNSTYSGISTEFPNDAFEIEFKDETREIINLPMVQMAPKHFIEETMTKSFSLDKN